MGGTVKLGADATDVDSTFTSTDAPTQKGHPANPDECNVELRVHRGGVKVFRVPLSTVRRDFDWPSWCEATLGAHGIHVAARAESL